MGKLDAGVAATVISGIARGCRNNGCALIGGETAEMPGMYADGEYDLAGFIVGAAERTRVLTGRKITKGDILLGLPSSGLHTNGYSLARKLLFEVAGYGPDTFLPELRCTVGEELLKVHRSYLRPIRKLLEEGILKGRGAYHRRRHHRQYTAHAAVRISVFRSTSHPGRRFRSSSCSNAWAQSRPTTCGVHSIWGSA